MKRLMACLSVAIVVLLAVTALAGPPVPGQPPRVGLAEALKLVDAHLKEQKIDPTGEQFIVSAVLSHRDNSNDRTPKAMGHYWDIKWELQLPAKGEAAKIKKMLRHEVDMEGKVYERE